MENLEALRKHKLPLAVGGAASLLLAMELHSSAESPTPAEASIASYQLPPPRTMTTSSLREEQQDWQALRVERATHWAGHALVQRATQTSRSETRHSASSPHLLGGYWLGRPEYYTGLQIKIKKHPDILHDAQVQYEVAKAEGLDDVEIADIQNISYREAGVWAKSGDPNGAYGLGQASPGKKMAHYGADWLTNPKVQATWMIDYVNKKYGNAKRAWAYWLAHDNY